MDKNAPSMLDFLGIKFEQTGPEFLRAKMPVTAHSAQIHGLLNGGASLALCEICAGAFSTQLIAPSGGTALGVQVSANHLRTAKVGDTVYCEIRPLRVGRTLHVLDAQVLSADRELICRATVTNAIRQPEKP